MSDSPILSFSPIINYPRQAQVGETYLITIDLQPNEGYEWKFKEEEYPVYCTVDSDIFTSKVVGEPIILMHRFGGSYGAARFSMTALPKVGQGEIKVCLINAWGVTVKVLKVDRIQLVTTGLIHPESDLTIETEVAITAPVYANSGMTVDRFSEIIIGSPNFFAYDNAWVGRENLIRDLYVRIRGNCRLLMLVGMAGIGKTALGERIAVEIVDWFENDWSHYHQENFDNDRQASDFANVAARWLEKWGELVTIEDRKDPQRLLNRLLKYLRENRYLIQMDSLEYILQGDEEEGWSDFKDTWWLKFFKSYLEVDSCQSCFILTSQDLPESIQEVGVRSQNFWYCQPLSGLDKLEQIALFEKTELDVSSDSPNRTYLERIGSAYEGHPLALRVIAGEIKNKPFEGNVQDYWEMYGHEVDEVEKAISEAQVRITAVANNKWQLERFTATLRRTVRSRLDKTFARLKQEAKWAYILLCETSIYNYPVTEDFWLSHLENWTQDKDEQRVALDALRDRFLIEELIDRNSSLFRQNNLIRSVSLSHLPALDNEAYTSENVVSKIMQMVNARFEEINLKKIDVNQLNSKSKLRHYRAIVNHLAIYQSSSTSSNIEQVRGYLESFNHLCELEDWENANRILQIQIDISKHESLLEQIGVWGYYEHQVLMCNKLIGKINHESDFKLLHYLGNAAVVRGEYRKAIEYFEEALRTTDLVDENYRKELVFNNLGNVYYNLGDYKRAIDCFSQALVISDESQNLSNKGKVLNNLGNVYLSLGDYSHAINVCEQSLLIARQLQNRMSEGLALANLGLIYNSIGEYDLSIHYCQQALVLSRELAYRRGEMIALDNLGLAYFSLGKYLEATQYHKQQLMIANEIEDVRGRGTAFLHLSLCSIETTQYLEALENLNIAFEIFSSIGDRLNQANTLKSLAELYQRLGEIDSAKSSIDLGLTIAVELGIPLVEELQALKISIASTSALPPIPCAVILTALPVEYLAVRAYLTNLQEEIHAKGTIYERGQFAVEGQTWDVGIVEIGAGNSGAALEAERAIAYFNPNVILFVGVASGIKDVALGDVVASIKVYGYESDKAEETFKLLPEIGLAAYRLEQQARVEARKGDWLQRISVTEPIPRVFVAPIAAGEKVIAATKSDVHKFIRSNYGDAVAVEMEGFGFLAAAQVNRRVSAMVIRGISELIDKKTKSDKARYQEIAARNASAFAFEILAKIKLAGLEQNTDSQLPQPIDEEQQEFYYKLLRQQFDKLEDRIGDYFTECGYEFNFNFLSKEIDELDDFDEVSSIEVINVDIVDILQLVDLDNDTASFEVEAEIFFSIEFTELNHNDYISDIHDGNDYPTMNQLIPNQSVVVTVKVDTLLPNDDNPEMEIESIELTVDKPILVSYRDAIFPESDELEDEDSDIEWREIEFEVITIEFREYPAIVPFDFEVATIVFYSQGIIVSPMTLERVFSIANEAIKSHRGGEELTALEQEIIEGTWRKLNYEKIADMDGFSTGYVRKVGAALFRCLSEELGKSISKRDMVEVFSKFVRSQKSKLEIEKSPGRAYQFVEPLSDSRSERLGQRADCLTHL
jgi:tetratricopeptide (TPR) repeat protein